jgi:hypothetical protein
MNRWKWLVLSVCALVFAGFAAPVSAGSHTASEQRAEEHRAAMRLTNLRITFHHANSALYNVLEAQQEYVAARADKDEMGMRLAAAGMFVSLAESSFWLAHLDAQVTASEFSDKIDKDVATLRELVATALDTLDEAFLANDLDAISTALDNSADAFNRLAPSIHSVINALWPKLGAA